MGPSPIGVCSCCHLHCQLSACCTSAFLRGSFQQKVMRSVLTGHWGGYFWLGRLFSMRYCFSVIQWLKTTWLKYVHPPRRAVQPTCVAAYVPTLLATYFRVRAQKMGSVSHTQEVCRSHPQGKKKKRRRKKRGDAATQEGRKENKQQKQGGGVC